MMHNLPMYLDANLFADTFSTVQLSIRADFFTTEYLVRAPSSCVAPAPAVRPVSKLYHR
jgi:hypothetical protein